MTLREKLLYHQVHPAKISIDVTTALAVGRYVGRNMTPPLKVARLVGVFIFWGAAWYRSVFYCSVGLLVIGFTWARGALQGSGRVAAVP